MSRTMRLACIMAVCIVGGAALASVAGAVEYIGVGLAAAITASVAYDVWARRRPCKEDRLCP